MLLLPRFALALGLVPVQALKRLEQEREMGPRMLRSVADVAGLLDRVARAHLLRVLRCPEVAQERALEDSNFQRRWNRGDFWAAETRRSS